MEQIQKEIQEDNFDFIALFFKFLKYWYVFAICGIIALIGAYTYTQFIVSIYEVNATLLIKEEKSSLLDDGAFGRMMNFGRRREIANEKAIIQSYSMIRATVKQLDFSVSYYQKVGYLQNELYKSTPFIVKYDSTVPQPVNVPFKLEFISEDKFKLHFETEKANLYSFIENKNIEIIENISLEKIASFGDSIKNKNFSFTIVKNPEYNGNIIPEDEKNKPEYTFIFNNLNKMALAYKSGTTVDLIEKDVDVFGLSLRGNNIRKITDFLNKLLEVYINKNLDTKNKKAKNTINFIDSQLSDITDSLKFAENSLQDFKSTHKVMDVSSQAESLFKRLSDLQRDKAVLLSKNKYYKFLLKSVKENTEYDELMAPSTMGINDPLLNKLVDEFITLSVQKITLSSNTSEKSPIIYGIERKLRNAKKLILKNVNNIINATDISIKEVDNRIVGLEKEAKKLPKTQQMLFGFERKFKLNDAIYTFLLQKRAESQIAEAASVPDAEIIDKARTDQYTKKSVKHRIIYVIALLIGLVIPAVVIYLLDLMNDRIASRKDIENITNLPFLGGIIQYKKPVTKVFAEFPKSSIAESFRSVYANIQYLFKGKEKNVVLVTSTMPKEGKTFNAINLASVFASFNKKTCLLSFDLRLPKVQDAFNFKNDVGLSTYLIKQSNFDDITYKTDIDNLDIIFSGPVPPNPVELIASEQASELFKFLKSKYDIVVVDSPPVGIVADALMLSQYSDVNVFVTRQNHTRKKALKNVIRELKEEEKKKTGILFNGIKSSGTYGYGYGGYGYGYGYGYGGYGYGGEYFSGDDNKKRKRFNFFRRKRKTT